MNGGRGGGLCSCVLYNTAAAWSGLVLLAASRPQPFLTKRTTIGQDGDSNRQNWTIDWKTQKTITVPRSRYIFQFKIINVNNKVWRVIVSHYWAALGFNGFYLLEQVNKELDTECCENLLHNTDKCGKCSKQNSNVRDWKNILNVSWIFAFVFYRPVTRGQAHVRRVKPSIFTIFF